MNQANEAQAVFTEIYHRNQWGSPESVSASGSEMTRTRHLRTELPHLLREFNIRSVLDIPCGDFNWMKEVVANTSVTYVGGDIVKPLIQQLSDTHSSHNVKFIHLDITKSQLPQADLMICRDCLIHLSYADTRAMLTNFLSSGIPYLLTTTHVNAGTFQNHDIATGDFRLIDLYSAPYNFPRDPLAVIDDWVPPDPERTICLWTRDQVSVALNT